MNRASIGPSSKTRPVALAGPGFSHRTLLRQRFNSMQWARVSLCAAVAVALLLVWSILRSSPIHAASHAVPVAPHSTVPLQTSTLHPTKRVTQQKPSTTTPKPMNFRDIFNQKCRTYVSPEVYKTSEGPRHPSFPNGAPIPSPFMYFSDPSNRDRKQRPKRKTHIGNGHAPNGDQVLVMKMIRHAWDGYRSKGFPHDEILAVSGGTVDWTDNPQGLTAIEALDTLWLAGMQKDFYFVVSWLQHNHTFDSVTQPVSLFECTIRMLGGLLSAYQLSGEATLLGKAFDLGTRLMGAFPQFHDKTFKQSGATSDFLPAASVRLSDGTPQHASWLGSHQSLSEVTTLQLEFKTLSYFTGYLCFDEVSQAVMDRILSFLPSEVGGLYPVFVDRASGMPVEGAPISLGSRGDSFYEYVAKQAAFTRYKEEKFVSAWNAMARGIHEILKIQLNTTHAFVAEAERTMFSGKKYQRVSKMDHLVCFLSGALLVGTFRPPMEDIKLAVDLGRTCAGMYFGLNLPTGLSPEIVRLDNNRIIPDPNSKQFLLRPETVEAMFYLLQFESDHIPRKVKDMLTELQEAEMKEVDDDDFRFPSFRDSVRMILASIERHCRTRHGYSGLVDVSHLNGGFEEKMHSYFFSETLKYALLALGNPEAHAYYFLDEWIFNTEGHLFRILPTVLS